ncbi:MAG: hypothetical protein COC15_02730 [Legionellales bacterium]|nr:MAG: hypothetical protein COC15_02730 [Legionellales bacterium]
MQIDFYLLKKHTRVNWWKFLYKLLDKIYKANKTVYVNVANVADQEYLDKFLWTHLVSGFLPHVVQDNEAPTNVPILIGQDRFLEDANKPTVLLNLSGALCTTWQNASRILEVIPQNSAAIQKGRELYAYYKKQNNTELHVHNI